MKTKHAEYESLGEPGKRGFEDLECYKLALDVMVTMHDLAQTLPPEEKYDLAAQIRRSSKCISANIAEGYGRYHYLDSLRFYSVARGELNETLAHLINARLLGYVEQEYFEHVYKLIRKVESILNGYMSYVRRRREGRKEYGDRTISDGTSEYEPGVEFDLQNDKSGGLE